jgi:hypothetical protein
MGEDAEAQFRILIKDLALWYIVTKIGGDECVILQYLLEEGTYLLTPGRTRMGFQHIVTPGSKLFEGMGHHYLSSYHGIPA